MGISDLSRRMGELHREFYDFRSEVRRDHLWMTSVMGELLAEWEIVYLPHPHPRDGPSIFGMCPCYDDDDEDSDGNGDDDDNDEEYYGRDI